MIRYEMSNQVHDSARVQISYVVANPSSYAYLDGLRPTVSALPANVAASAPGLYSARARSASGSVRSIQRCEELHRL